jgi:hypothetical protein
MHIPSLLHEKLGLASAVLLPVVLIAQIPPSTPSPESFQLSNLSFALIVRFFICCGKISWKEIRVVCGGVLIGVLFLNNCFWIFLN